MENGVVIREQSLLIKPIFSNAQCWEAARRRRSPEDGAMPAGRIVTLTIAGFARRAAITD